MGRNDGTANQTSDASTRHAPSRVLLWIAATSLTLIGVALFLVGFFRQGLLGAVFYLIVVAMGLYLFTVPWRQRRAEARADTPEKP